jgi:hypothetical protein
MPLILTGRANQGGSVGMKITIVDENGDALIPTAATWTLTDLEGNVINSRTDVAISPLASEMTVLMSGDDLQIADETNEYEIQLFSFEGTYDPGDASAVPITESGEFPVYNMEVKT